jgi:pyruvate/2-oxoglutarate dehydrogenase complex dihydrolipoamide acyltransferase (E2) component
MPGVIRLGDCAVGGPACCVAAGRLLISHAWLLPASQQTLILVGIGVWLSDCSALRFSHCCRENQQLRAEHGALSERLRLSSSGSGANGSAHGQSPELAAAQQAAAAAAQQLQEVEAEVQRAREDAQAARTAARKLEMDLEDLSAAYGTLDAHAGSLQQQVEQLQLELAAERRRQQQQGAQAPAGGSSSGDVGGIGEAEVQRQVEAARQEAQQEADDAMGDLLVCLGQEEAKVGAVLGSLCVRRLGALGCAALLRPLCCCFFLWAVAELAGLPPPKLQVARLRQRLEAQGVDCDALLADIVDAVGEEEDMT